MCKPEDVIVDFTGDFRQVVLKLANSYDPTIEPPIYFQNLDEMIDAYSKLLCEDFSTHLFPLIREKMAESIDRQLR